MKLTDEWFTAIAESETGNRTIFISGRCHIDEFRESGKFPFRAEITWNYHPDLNGMPDESSAQLMEETLTALKKAMEKDKLAILTGIYTGDSERNMIFYTRNITAFGNRLNEALATFEQLPITIYTENDSEWNEYAEMQELNPGDDEDDEELL